MTHVSQFPDGEGMALLKWHQEHDGALNMPGSRTLSATDWIPERDALSLGLGCGLSINGAGNAAHIDAFIFVSKSNADTGLLIVGDLGKEGLYTRIGLFRLQLGHSRSSLYRDTCFIAASARALTDSTRRNPSLSAWSNSPIASIDALASE